MALSKVDEGAGRREVMLRVVQAKEVLVSEARRTPNLDRFIFTKFHSATTYEQLQSS